MNRLRQMLLELWATFVLAAVVGFLGPFGTYGDGLFLDRFGRWYALTMGAYVLVRPLIVILERIAVAVLLPIRGVVVAGIVAASFPLTLLWQSAAANELRELGGYRGVLPFALLCSVVVLFVTWWSRAVDERQQHASAEAPMVTDGAAAEAISAPPLPSETAGGASGEVRSEPRLMSRLPGHFVGPVHALESEDHYVRVHGASRSELILMRLRDAIVEMDGTPGEQVHRSWWLARSAIGPIAQAGRGCEVLLPDGCRVPIARDSVDRLRRSGFLPG